MQSELYLNILPEFILKDGIKTFAEILVYMLIVGGTILLTKLKSIKDKITFKKTHTQYNQSVFEKLVELRTLTDANRTYVFGRHNGVKLHNGNGIDKISMLYESCDNSTKSTKEQSQNMSLILFNEQVAKLDSDLYGCIVTEELEESFLKRNLIDKGVHTMLLAPFRKNKNDIPEGYVGISYTEDGINNISFEVDKEEITKILVEFTNVIGYIMRS